MNLEARRRLLKAFMFGAAASGVSPLLTACGGGGGTNTSGLTLPPPPTGTTSSSGLGAANSPASPSVPAANSRFSRIGALQAADANGVMLPPGFSSRVVALSTLPPLPGKTPWHIFSDGAGVMALDDGGYLYISNSEVPGLENLEYAVPNDNQAAQVLALLSRAGITTLVPGLGGAGVLRFDANGNLTDSYPILRGTTFNCAGVVTPWNTWLSCEEYVDGRVWEVNPLAPIALSALPLPLLDTVSGVLGGLLSGLTFGQPNPVSQVLQGSGKPISALGIFAHEAVAIDPDRKVLYMTEDEPDGRFYRFVPTAADWPAGAMRPALQNGALQVLSAEEPLDRALLGPIRVRWIDAKNPGARQRDNRLPDSAIFKGGEGVWYRNGLVYFTTKGDDRVWQLDTVQSTLTCIYDRATASPGEDFLSGVDNIVVTDEGDILVCEDGGDMQIVAILPDGSKKVVLQIVGQDISEIAGLAFSPDKRRMYFSSDRAGPDPRGGYGPGLGMIYEILIPATL